MDEKKQIEEMAGHIKEMDFHLSNNVCTVIATVLHVLGYRKQSGWISVDERLPESRNIVIVCDEYGNVGEAYFYQHNRRFRWVYNEELAFATHWMPLPEAPKGE